MSRRIFTICAINMLFCLALGGVATEVHAQSDALPPVQAPYPGRPGSDGPGQGEVAAVPSDNPVASATTDASIAQALRADLVLTRSFKVGSVNIPWGESGVISATNAISKTSGKCVFRYRYITRNQGQMTASSVTNGIFLGAQNGAALASVILPALVKNAQASSIGEVALKPGVSTLYVHTDAMHQVTESDEANNRRRVQVTVQGDCAAL